MEFIEGKAPTLISNAELMQILGENIEARKIVAEKDRRRKPSIKFQHRDFIEAEVYNFLQTTPCVQLDMKRSKQFKAKLMQSPTNATNPNTATVGKRRRNDDSSAPTTTSETESLASGFGLTEAEALQILNFMPKEIVDLHLMIEKLPSRMSDEKQEKLLELIQSYTNKEDDNEEQENSSKNEAMDVNETEESNYENATEKVTGQQLVGDNGKKKIENYTPVMETNATVKSEPMEMDI